MEEGDVDIFFLVQDLRLALMAKTCPHQPHSFKEVTIGQGFHLKETMFCLLLRLGSVPGTHGISATRFTQIFEDIIT